MSNMMMDNGINGGEQRKDKKKRALQASSRKGCMKGKGGPLNAYCTFKGVRQRTWGRWVSEIREPKTKTRIWLGTHNTARDAALAYDSAALKLFGPDAPLNLPDEASILPIQEPTSTQKAIALTNATAEARNRFVTKINVRQQDEKECQKRMYIQMIHENQLEMERNKQIQGAISGMTSLNIDKPHIEEAIVENKMAYESEFKSYLNTDLPEFDDSTMWKEVASTMDYQMQAICDPGIDASSFNDAIGIVLRNPLTE